MNTFSLAACSPSQRQRRFPAKLRPFAIPLRQRKRLYPDRLAKQTGKAGENAVRTIAGVRWEIKTVCAALIVPFPSLLTTAEFAGIISYKLSIVLDDDNGSTGTARD
ncbi:hypothetical protein ACPVTF_08380 [Geobacillus icigianus]|uniref:hypothetical protein n=1 Tax=Geobacillus icigianus TaxID=1430331 RepID=UPI000A4F3310